MLLTEYDIHDFQTEVCADNTTDKQSKTHSFRSGSPTWSSKSSMCGSDRTGFASSSRMTDSLASEGHPAFRGGGGNGNRPPVMAGGGPPSVASDQDQVDTYSVTSGGSIMYREPGLQEDQGPGGGGHHGSGLVTGHRGTSADVRVTRPLTQISNHEAFIQEDIDVNTKHGQ